VQRGGPALHFGIGGHIRPGRRGASVRRTARCRRSRPGVHPARGGGSTPRACRRWVQRP
jgi:hypothetical protein